MNYLLMIRFTKHGKPCTGVPSDETMRYGIEEGRAAISRLISYPTVKTATCKRIGQATRHERRIAKRRVVYGDIEFLGGIKT